MTKDVTLEEAIRVLVKDINAGLKEDEEQTYAPKHIEVELTIVFKPSESLTGNGRWLVDRSDGKSVHGGAKHTVKLTVFPSPRRDVMISSEGSYRGRGDAYLVRNEDYTPPPPPPKPKDRTR